MSSLITKVSKLVTVLSLRMHPAAAGNSLRSYTRRLLPYRCSLHCCYFSSALQDRLTAGLCHCNSTYGDLIFIQMCSEPTEMHCNTGLGKMHAPLFSGALQNKLTTGLCECSYTSEDLLFIQVCSGPPEMHCSTGLGRMQSPLFSAALQNRLTAGLGDCNYTYGDLLFIQVCSGV